jgi:hypothetical protein
MRPALVVVAFVLAAGCGADPAAGDNTEQQIEPTSTTDLTAPTDVIGVFEVQVFVGNSSVDLIVGDSVLEAGVRLDVAAGTQVRIVTSGEIADQVHIHGYEVRVDVTPGESNELEFIADETGRFAVELEFWHLPIFDLRVQ